MIDKYSFTHTLSFRNPCDEWHKPTGQMAGLGAGGGTEELLGATPGGMTLLS